MPECSGPGPPGLRPIGKALKMGSWGSERTMKITDNEAVVSLGKGSKAEEKISRVASAEIGLFERFLILEIRGSKM